MADLISLELLLEQVKTDLYREIIQNNTTIQLPLETSSTTIKNRITNIVHLFNTVSSEQLTLIENDFIIEDDDEEEINNTNTQLQKSLNKIPFYNPSFKSTTRQELEIIHNKCNSFLETLMTDRIFRKPLESLKSLKLQLARKMNFKDYINLLESHISFFKSFCEQKQHTLQKLEECVLASSTPLDLRLITYNCNHKYNLCIKQLHTSYLEADEIETLNKMLIFEKRKDDSHIQPLDYNVFIPFLLTYGSVTMTIRKLFERIIIPGNNIVYFRPSSKKENDNLHDSYSFYYLKKVDDTGKHYWYMDCRLEELTSIIINNLLPYLIKIFRSMYHDVFHDNIYRKNFIQFNIFLEYDANQLLENICTLSNYCKTCDILRETIYNQCHHVQNENDNFNIISDDSLQKKAFDKKRNSLDYFETIRLIFDDICDEDIEELYT
jgi:hypothetical protein